MKQKGKYGSIFKTRQTEKRHDLRRPLKVKIGHPMTCRHKGEAGIYLQTIRNLTLEVVVSTTIQPL
jgi:hypothetical protein